MIEARDEVYYRTKAAAVLGMLRSIVGDDALRRALQLYRDDKMDSDPKEFQRVLERTAKRDLGWFFDDWVYRDRGLPDLSIASVTPRAIDQIGNKGSGWLVAVEVRNDGGAVAEVPVTVRSGTLTSTQRLRIPARSSASTRIVFEGTPTGGSSQRRHCSRSGVVDPHQADRRSLGLLLFDPVGGPPLLPARKSLAISYLRGIDACKILHNKRVASKIFHLNELAPEEGQIPARLVCFFLLLLSIAV